MKTLCYIQARGGSKRFPGKNKHKWDGVPFVVNAIYKAQMAEIFDLVMVTSDDIEILNLARDAGALPVLRSQAMSGDLVTDDQLAEEVLLPLSGFDIACKLYPCVPLLSPDDLTAAYYALLDSEEDYLRAVDKQGKDAGAFYFFRVQPAIDYTISKLNRLDYILDYCQDINTLDDLWHAKQKQILIDAKRYENENN